MKPLNVLVTGGTRGIGAGIVRELADAGHNVMFCGRSNSGYAGSPASHPQNGKIVFHPCDISREEDRKDLISAFLREFGTMDALVNNAGVAPEQRTDILEMKQESFDRVMNINLKGPFFLTQLAVKELIRNQHSAFRCIINIGSVSAVCAHIERGEYCLSKAGVAMATKLWAARLACEGIAVYELRPGIIKSDMTRTVTEKYDRLIEEGLTLQKRWGLPSDIGKAVRMLLSGDLAYSTGQVINIDGGLLVERF